MQLGDIPEFPAEESERIAVLRRTIRTLPVDEAYRAHLLINLERYREKILLRPVYSSDEGWDDLEALQQVTLGNLMEAHLKALMQ